MGQKITYFAIASSIVLAAVAARIEWQSRKLPAGSRPANAEITTSPIPERSDTGERPRPMQGKTIIDYPLGAPPIRLQPGVSQHVIFNFRTQPQQRFVVHVPANAVVMQVEIKGAPCIFDVYGRALLPINDAAVDAEHYNGALENVLRVSRYEDYPLETGEYYLTLEYASIYPPALGNRTLNVAEFEILVTFIHTRIDGQLRPGEPLAGQLDPDTGSFRTFIIDVPKNAPALRIDLDNAHSDLDVLARHGSQLLHPEDADLTAAGRVGREILVLDEHSDPPLAPGRWYVNVVEPMATDHVGFTIYASLDARPPQALLAIPPPPVTPSAKDVALCAVVDLTTGTYSGSGVFISPTGLILTNHHVVAEAIVAAEAQGEEARRHDDGERGPALDDVIVALTLDPRHPPVEMFRATVIEHDAKEDLALAQVTRGYYGQPIPADYRFPHVELGQPESLAMGDSLFVVGFPAVGDLRNRPSVTLTRGIVSGFSGVKNIKTDAHISAGNSGGGAFDAQWRLIGCPTTTVSGANGDYGQLGYVVSLSALPAAWRQRLK